MKESDFPLIGWEWGITLLAGVAAVVEDLRRRQIPNWICVCSLAAGIALQIEQFGWTGLGRAVLGAGCGFSVFLLFYLLGGMGGGDVKLMAAFGAVLGPRDVWLAAWWVALIGGIFAAGVWLWTRFQGRGGRVSIPYAPAIALGVWAAQWARSH